MKTWLAPRRFIRFALLLAVLTVGVTAIGGCESWNGHLNLFGYSSEPQIPANIKTVYVPIFKNKTVQYGPYRGMEFELTRQVIIAVEMKGYKVISDPNRADTELLGTIVGLTKNILNRTQQNEVREGETVLSVELVCRDLRTGVVLTNPPKPLGTPIPTELPPFDLDNLPRPDALERAIPVVVTMSARFLPEVGETNTTSQSKLCIRLAQQIANMMERDWRLPPKPIPANAIIQPEPIAPAAPPP